MKQRPKSGTLRREDAQLIHAVNAPRRPSSSASSSSRTVMTLRELGRIKQGVIKDLRLSNYVTDKKKVLKELSDEKTKRFPDTLEAVRERRAQFVRLKKQEAEEKRKAIDKEEAEYQKLHRDTILKNAESHFFKHTDRMKLLQSKQALIETVNERKSQIEEKNKRKQIEMDEAAKYHKFIMSQVSQGEEQEKEKLLKQQKLISEMKIDREKQIKEIQERRAIEAAEAQAIGEASRKRAEELVLEEQEKMKQREESIAQQNREIIIANEKDKELKMFLKKKEIEAAEKLEAEVANIEFRKQARKDVASRMFKEAQVRREQIIARATKLLQEQSAESDRILGKQLEEAETKRVAIEKAKKEKKERELKMAMDSWNADIQEKSKAWHRRQEESKILLQKSKENAIRMANEAKKEEEDKWTKIAEFKKQQKYEATAMARKRIEDRTNKIARERLVLKELMGGDDAKFKTAAVEQIESNLKNGLIIKPLLPLLEMDMNPLMAAKLNPSKRRQKGLPPPE